MLIINIRNVRVCLVIEQISYMLHENHLIRFVYQKLRITILSKTNVNVYCRDEFIIIITGLAWVLRSCPTSVVGGAKTRIQDVRTTLIVQDLLGGAQKPVF